MTTMMRSHMHRHTRPASFVTKFRKAEAVAFSRPGGRSFSFNGEFPDVTDHQPVEVGSRRRNYTSGHAMGSYHAVRQDDTSRVPAVSKYGVRLMPALVMLTALMVLLGSVLLFQMSQRDKVQASIDYKEHRISVLTGECANTERVIASQSNDVNIRQEAVRMGLINAKGVKVQYLEAPQDAVITLADKSAIQSLASIWGR